MKFTNYCEISRMSQILVNFRLLHEAQDFLLLHKILKFRNFMKFYVKIIILRFFHKMQKTSENHVFSPDGENDDISLGLA